MPVTQSYIVTIYICCMIDEIRVVLFLKQTNILRDALHSKNKKHISDAYKKMNFTEQEFSELPKDILSYYQSINKRALDFLDNEN
jgi:hypothetical protein